MTDNPDEGYDFPCFSYDTENSVALNTAYIMTGNLIDLKYILGVLNSKLGRILVKFYVTQLQQKQYRMLNQYVTNFPIPKNKNTQKIAILVDEILKSKANHQSFKDLEHKINNIVYQYYELDEEEINFIQYL